MTILRASIKQESNRSSFTLLLVGIHLYQKLTKTKLELYLSLCSRMLLPHVDSYEERLKQLQINELNTQLSEVCERSSERTPSAEQLYTGGTQSPP